MTNKVEDILLRIHAYQIFVPTKESNDYIRERFSHILSYLYEDRLNSAIADYSDGTLNDAEIAL